MKGITIKDAIVEILKECSEPLSAKEIFERIIERKLYIFKSKTPVSIVNFELKKNAFGVNIKKANSNKIFEFLEGGKYKLKL